jgi:FkbM family methyltransferase
LLKFLLHPLFAATGYVLFKIRSAKLRGYWYAFIRKRYPDRYLCVDQFNHPYVVHTSDNGTSREVFRSGQLDIEKFTRVIELLSPKAVAKLRVLLDIGANLGTICIPMVAAGHFERAIAVEPDPLNLRLLRTNIALNELHDRIEVVDRAAADQDGLTLSLEHSPINTGDHRISVSDAPGLQREEDRNRIEVQSITIDAIVEADEAPANDILIWMDVQGYEGWALAGAAQTLAQTPPLVIEFWPYGIQRAGSFDALQQALTPYGSFVDLADPTARRRSIDELTALYKEIGEGGNYTDLMVMPN